VHTDKWRRLRMVKVKLKVKLSLCFKWAPRHGGVLVKWRYSTTHSLTSAQDGGEWSEPLVLIG
jgi:hypothetical protein